uniref:Uncharacterized protein n=1 Tax=Helianthus annuus TaxID=4232 RepID=A0A251UY80_HELAN
MFVGDMEGVHSYVEGICERDGLVGVVEDDMEGVHSSQFLGKNGEEWPNVGSLRRLGSLLGRRRWIGCRLWLGSRKETFRFSQRLCSLW